MPGKSHGVDSRFIRLRGLVCVAALLYSTMSYAQSNPSISDVFQNVLACAVVDPLLSNSEPLPLYASDNTECIGAVPDDADTQYYSDAECNTPVEFSPTSLYNYCDSILNPSALGEGDGIVVKQWTLSPGNRLDLGARTLDDVIQPYMLRTIYRDVETSGGSCELEMRVYSPRPGVTNQGSLLALHGGSWSARGFGFFGLELTIPHFVDQGFVVFAPFYRLLGDSEGSAACNNASISEITSDAEAALKWVQDNAPSYGGTTTPVVFGQSAGAHLALSLSVNKAGSVAAGILLYPPTDFTDFALRVRNGSYDNDEGLGILDSVIGVSAEDADLNASPIPENSFPIRIVENDLNVAPLLVIQGMEDDLVEARQSIRLCDALAGRELLAADEETPGIEALREVIECGEDSSLHLVKEGKHALDVCLLDFLIPTDICPSGSTESRQEVSQAMADYLAFAHDAVASQLQAAPSRRSGSFSLIAVFGLVVAGIIRVTGVVGVTHLRN